MKYRHAAFTLVELTIALAIAALLTGAAIQTWSRHHERARRTAAHAALVSTMVELERQYAHTGNSSSPANIPEYISGYHLLAGPCDGRAAAHCIEVVAQPVHAGTDCGALIPAQHRRTVHADRQCAPTGIARMLAMNASRLRAGFTLAELVVVLSVISILAMFAAPAALNWWQRETVVVLADRFVSAISLAQTMSRNQRAWVHLGPCNAEQGWSSGWALYMMPSPQTQATPLEPGTEDILMRVSPPVVPPVEFAFTASQRDVDTLSFAPVGYSRQRNGSQLYGTLTIRSGAHERRVRISSAGRARICDPAKDTKTCGASASANDD